MSPKAPSLHRRRHNVGAAMLMGSSYPFAKDVLAVMSPLLYSASRYLVAGLFLFAVTALMRRPMALPRRDWLPMIVLSLIGVALFQACWGLAMARTAPSLGSIVMTTTTAFSAILAWLGGRRLPALGWLGIVIAFAGVVLVVNNSLARSRSFGRPGRHADLDAGGLRLGALCRALCALQPAAGRAARDGLDDADRLAAPAADVAGVRRPSASSPASTTACWATGSTPRSSPWAWPSSA